MPGPVVSRLWIAASESALASELVDISPEYAIEVRAALRAAAINAEELMNLVAGPRGAARSSALAMLVERFGGDAIDVDRVGAAFIAEAVESVLVGAGHADARRVAERCRVAVREAGAAIDALAMG